MWAWGAGALTAGPRGAGTLMAGKAHGAWGAAALAAEPIPDARPRGWEGAWARGVGALTAGKAHGARDAGALVAGPSPQRPPAQPCCLPCSWRT